MTSKRRAPGEGSIYQRQDGRWVAALTLGAGMRKSFYRETRAEAVLALQEAHQANMQGTLISMRKETLETFLTCWLQYQILPTVRERTYRTYQQTIQTQVLPSLGSFTLQKLTHWHLLRFYHRLRRQQMAPTTIQKTHRILHHALEDAVKWGHVTHNVAQFVELPPVQKNPRVTQALSVEQAHNLLTAAQNDPLEALYVLALTTGMREARIARVEVERSGSHAEKAASTADAYWSPRRPTNGGRAEIADLTSLHPLDGSGGSGASPSSPLAESRSAQAEGYVGVLR